MTHDIKLILGDLARGDANGSTALLDATYDGLLEIRTARNARRVLLVISDGEDNHSRYSGHELGSLLRESPVQIYAISAPQIVYSRMGGGSCPRERSYSEAFAVIRTAEVLRSMTNGTCQASPPESGWKSEMSTCLPIALRTRIGTGSIANHCEARSSSGFPASSCTLAQRLLRGPRPRRLTHWIFTEQARDRPFGTTA